MYVCVCRQGITSDLFPGIRLPETDYSTFNAAVRESCREANLQCTDYFLEKIQQVRPERSELYCTRRSRPHLCRGPDQYRTPFTVDQPGSFRFPMELLILN